VLASRLMSEPESLRPDVSLDLEWEGELCFRGRAGDVELVLDSDARKGPSPVQALAFALAGCMAIDVVHILRKGRLDVRGLKAALAAERAPRDPRRIVRVRLHFRVTGDVPADKVERAIALSRETYCSVWHSLRPDTDFATSFEVAAAP
jgi:putative redox protein